MIFKEKNVVLSAGARVVDQYRYSWLVTDQGAAYYMEATPPVVAANGKPGKAGQLKISKADLELIYSDLTAVITGPNANRFALSNTSPTFRQIPALPDRRQPYREYTIIYHQALFAAQAFGAFRNSNLVNVIAAGGDNFAINYGSAAIGPEVVANRLGVGPMGNKDAVDLKFEEFFLSAWAVGDPAMVVDHPANAPNAIVGSPDEKRQLRTLVPDGSIAKQLADANNKPTPALVSPAGFDDFAPLKKTAATKAFYPDDPSNVYHSYMSDHVKFRILHAGSGPSHVHHLHAHQWLRSPDSDSSSYLDSQLLVPGTAFTLEITYNGSGNRNKTVGDSIFHCHLYPHFAQGMWALWRVHDVFEEGTKLDPDGRPEAGINRALPDGEIERGTPIPAIVPLPTLAMAPMPAKVQLTDLFPWKPGQGLGRRVEVIPEETKPDGEKVYKNPGFPFFVPGVSGHRPPHPPLDFAWLEDPATRLPVYDDQGKKISLDGGLPRHLVLDGKVVKEFHTRWDFSKDTALRDAKGEIVKGGGSLTAMEVPEEGTPVLAAMKEHSIRTRPMAQPNGEMGNFILNGLPPTNGAPFADPGVNDQGNANVHRRRYQGAVFQSDTVFNKKSWHYPQQRMISLWQDVAPTIDKTRAPEPFFFRTNTSDSIQFWHTNLLPSYYELDDFQVRTPTDIVGQHIHLVKFDVLASDGVGNGYNYEDGTFAPDEVQERIDSINTKGGMFAFDPVTGFVNPAKQNMLTVKSVADYYPPANSTFIKLENGVPTWKKPPGMTGSVFAPTSPSKEWSGAQTTIQLWEVDALLNNEGVDRTLRTVFSHDHFGPSTHQEAGLYAGMVVEPENSEWYLQHGERMNTRQDGGPTSWHGYIVTENPKDSYREFMLEFQDMQLGYRTVKGESLTQPSNKLFDPNQPKASAAFSLMQINQDPIILASKTPGEGEYAGFLAAMNFTSIDAYKKSLNNQELPKPTFVGQIPVIGFKELFLQYGIPLSANAVVTVNTLGKEWTITEAPNEINAGTKYILRVVPTGKDQGEDILVYTPDITPGWADPKFALNSPTGANNDPENGLLLGPPFASIVSQNQFGTYSLNYRNEPLPLRVQSPPAGPLPIEFDLAAAFASLNRADPELNVQPDGTPGFPKIPLVPNAQGTDPYTPLLEAYVNDHVQIRTLVGAHTQSHALQIHGVKWLFEPDKTNSGWRNSQLMGLSEHFEYRFDLPGTASSDHSGLTLTPSTMPPFADYLYAPSSDIVGLNNGLWGIMRAYGALLPEVDGRQSLQPLPNNPNPTSLAESRDLIEEGYAAAPKEKQRNFDVTAVAASALPGGLLVYNAPKLKTAQAVLYFQTEDLDFTGGKVALKKDRPLEPLILRAAAGDWIRVTLRNAIPSDDPAVRLPQTLPYGTPFSGNIDNPGALPQVNMLTSALVGLHPQLVAFNPIKANGVRVGFNKNYLLGPGPNPNPQPGMPPVGSDFYWYAGEVSLDSQGKVQGKPIEFGATNLTPADPLLQAQFGMVGALIIEPEGATWRRADLTSRATVDVKAPNANVFREFVVIDQNMVANAPSKTAPFAPAQGKIGAINYRTEPRGLRIPSANVPASPQGYSQLFSNSVNNPPVDPQTPVFVAAAGTPVRFRLLVPSTSTSNAVAAPPVFIVSGHNFQQEPYIEDSTMIGFNPLSETHGAVRGGVGDKFDLLFQSAGGHGKVAGDYLYLTYQTAGVAGTWGLFRVTAANVRIENASIKGGSVQVNGSVEVVAQCGALPQKLQVTIATEVEGVSKLGSADVEADGKWSFKADTKLSGPALIQVQEIGSNGEVGATATVGVPAPASAKPAPLQVIEADLRSIPGGYHGATVSRRAAIQ